MATPVTSIQTTTAPISQLTQCSQGAFCQLVRKYLFFPSNRMMTREKWGLLTELLAHVTEFLTIIFLVTAQSATGWGTVKVPLVGRQMVVDLSLGLIYFILHPWLSMLAPRVSSQVSASVQSSQFTGKCCLHINI